MIARRVMDADGFSLVEVLVAAGLVATALVSLAALFSLAIRGNVESRVATYTTILAAAKVEELRSTIGLTPSPSGALDSDTPGYVDYVDRFGRPVARGAGGAEPLAFTRRWDIHPLPGTAGALVIQVLVRRAVDSLPATEHTRLPGEARLVTVTGTSAN